MTPAHTKSITRRLFQYFLNGLLIAVPISVVLYIIYRLFIFFDDLILPLLNQTDTLPENYRFRGLGIILLVLIITTLGFIGTTLIARPIKKWIDGMLNRVPLVKTIYTAITDLLSAFVGQKKRFNQPVLVRISKDSQLQKIGFITDSDLSRLGEFEDRVAVYFPHSYNFSGNLFIVNSEHIEPISKNPADVMKYIVSGGVSEINKE